MNEQVTGAMLALIRRVVCGVELTEEERKGITPALLPQLYALSKSHDMAHIVARGLAELGLLGKDEISAKFQKQQMLAVYRCRQMEYELERLCGALEEAKIPFIPLKGSVLRAYYPESWMRTSCDIDVLVHEEDLERATQFLKEKDYKIEEKSSHDISIYSAGGVHIELHYETIEQDRVMRADSVLSQIWEDAFPQEQDTMHLYLSDRMFYFYHVAHMAKHFEDGGCGIRPFLDLWVLEKFVQHGDQARDSLLEQGGLLAFANAGRRLSNAWFCDAEHDETTGQMQSFVLFGGVYGTMENRVAVHQNKQGGKFRYAFSRIFLPYDTIKFQYPILKKHRWLTPLMEVCRWFRLLFQGRVKSSLYMLNLNRTMSQEQMASTDSLLQKIGLK